MSNDTRVLTLAGKKGGKTIYHVAKKAASQLMVAAGGSADGFDSGYSRSDDAFSRADQLGLKISSRSDRPAKPKKQHQPINYGSNKTVLPLVENEFAGNLMQSGVLDDDLDDELALQKANALSVKDQNPFYHDNEFLYQGSDDADQDKDFKPKRRGAGFLGRNNRRGSKERS